MDTLLPKTPSSYSSIIKSSFRLYRTSFLKVIWLSALLSITAFVPRLLSYAVGQDLLANLAPLSPHRLWFIALEIIGLAFFIGILWHMHCVIRKVHEPLIEDLYVGIRKVLAVFVAALIQGVIIVAVLLATYGLQRLLISQQTAADLSVTMTAIIIALFIFELALIVYIYTLFIFLTPLIATENAGIFAALKKSTSLVWNHWWRVFSVQYTPWITYVFLLAFIRSIFHINLHIYFIQRTPQSIWVTLLHVVIFALFIPWVAAVLLVQLKDLELRKQLIRKK